MSVAISDGDSSFANEVYVGHQRLRELVVQLDAFNGHVYAGIYDLNIGMFGPEFASGALHLRFHFQQRGYLNITAHAQSDFKEFGKLDVASEATLYLVTQAAQLDDFIRALRAMSEGDTNEAWLQAS